VTLALVLLCAPARAVDTDADGLDDADERTWGTDPSLPDTDGDTVGDGSEILVLGTDPLADERRCAPWDDTLVMSLAGMGHSVTAADLDGDLDVDVFSCGVNGVGAWRSDNLGTGQFAPGQRLAFPDWGAMWLQVADLDGDGDSDPVIASGADGVHWAENLGGGVLGAFAVIAESAASVLEVGDLDGDGDPDIVLGNILELKWYENLGGTFGGQRSIASRETETLVVADLDGNGVDDVAWGTPNEDQVWIVLARGGGSFEPKIGLGSGVEPSSIAAFDADGDQDLDLLFGDTTNDLVGWYENLGAGTFDGVSNIVASSLTFPAVSSGDLDADGDADIVAADMLANEVVWYPNLGGGSFGPRSPVGEGLGAYRAVVADVDADGVSDVVTTFAEGSNTRWFRSPYVDGDADGLSDAAETCITGTDPSLADTDAGGVDDGLEVALLTDPTDGTDDPCVPPAADADADGACDEDDADDDGDGTADVEDCAPLDPGVPSAEVPGDGIDQDCDGEDASEPPDTQGADPPADGDSPGREPRARPGTGCAAAPSGTAGSLAAFPGLVGLVRRPRRFPRWFRSGAPRA
jgi:hypothetical protein